MRSRWGHESQVSAAKAEARKYKLQLAEMQEEMQQEITSNQSAMAAIGEELEATRAEAQKQTKRLKQVEEEMRCSEVPTCLCASAGRPAGGRVQHMSAWCVYKRCVRACTHACVHAAMCAGG